MSLKSVNQKENSICELEIVIDAETFAKARVEAYKKAKKDIAIPGFRKGKVPMKMIESRYGEGFFYEDALDICYPEAAEAAIKESGIEFVASNKVDIKKIGSDGVELLLEVTVKPETDIKEYKQLKATQKKIEVTAEEIDSRIDALRERNSRVEAKTTCVENGDIVNIDFEGFIDGKAFEGGKAEEFDLTIGSGSFIPGFEEQIIGHEDGDDFDINVTFPEEYGADELAGKEAVFKVKIHEVKVKILPELDDEFAQEVSEFDTVEELKKDTENKIKEEKTEQNEREITRQLYDLLAENLIAVIPDAMVDNEIDSEIRDIEYRLSMQGMDFNTYLSYMGMSIEQYREGAKENAQKNVKIRLALEKIAQLEGLEATDEDVEELYKKYAEMYEMDIEEIRKIIPAETVKGDIAVDKASKFVRENAKVTTSRKKKAKADEKTEEASDDDE